MTSSSQDPRYFGTLRSVKTFPPAKRESTGVNYWGFIACTNFPEEKIYFLDTAFVENLEKKPQNNTPVSFSKRDSKTHVNPEAFDVSFDVSLVTIPPVKDNLDSEPESKPVPASPSEPELLSRFENLNSVVQPESTSKKNQLPFPNQRGRRIGIRSKKEFDSLRSFIAQNSDFSKNDIKTVWENSAIYHIENINDIDYKIDGRFTGIITDIIFNQGWACMIWCASVSSLIYCKHNDKKNGDMNPGEKIEFGIRIGIYNSEFQFQAEEWETDFIRKYETPFPSFLFDELSNFDPDFTSIIKASSPVLVYGEDLEPLKNKLEREQWKSIKHNHIIWKGDSQHPYIKKSTKTNFKSVLVDINEQIGKLPFEPLNEQIKLAFVNAVHHHQISNRTDTEWTILGDETGDLHEFKNRTTGRKTRFLWVVIPPWVNTSDLPLLPPYYHGTDAEQFETSTTNAFQNLYNNPDIIVMTFSYEDGQVPSSLPRGPLNDPILLLWEQTLPLVLEYIFSQSKIKKFRINILLERTPLNAPSKDPLNIIKDLALLYEDRKDVEIESEGFSCFVLQKNPLEHGWLGYTDLIGRLYDDDISNLYKEIAMNVKEKTLELPYRSHSLFNLKKLLMVSTNGLRFLQGLYSHDIREIEDYVKPILSNLVKYSLNQLTENDWQILLDFMEINKEQRHVSSLLLNLIDFVSVIEKISESDTKFDFCLAMIGNCNHTNQKELSQSCKDMIDDMIVDGYIPRENRKMKMVNLFGGREDNRFCFESRVLLPINIPSNRRLSEEEIPYYGALSVSNALYGSKSSRETALRIEEILLPESSDFSKQLRRWVYRGELLMDMEKHEEALDIFLNKIPSLAIKKGEDLSDSYFLVGTIKALVYCEKPPSENMDLVSKIPLFLNKQHPSQRLAYWGIRWLSSEKNSNEEIIELCKKRLCELTKEDEFQSDAAAVILSLELRDLIQRNLIEYEEWEDFHKKIMYNSEDSTTKWVIEHYEIDNPLAPLNFNYL